MQPSSSKPFQTLPPLLSMAISEPSTSAPQQIDQPKDPEIIENRQTGSSYAWCGVFSEDYLAIGHSSPSISPERRSPSTIRLKVLESSFYALGHRSRSSSPSRHRDSNLRTRLEGDPDNEKEEESDEYQRRCESESLWEGIGFRLALSDLFRQSQGESSGERTQNISMDILQEDASESVFQPSKLRMRGTGSERDELLHEDAWQPIQEPSRLLPPDRQAMATYIQINGAASIVSLFPYRKSVEMICTSQRKGGKRVMNFYHLCEATKSLSTTGQWEDTGYCGQISKGYDHHRHLKTKHLGVERESKDAAIVTLEGWAMKYAQFSPSIAERRKRRRTYSQSEYDERAPKRG